MLSTETQTEEPTIQLDRLDEAAQAILFTDARTANSFAGTPVTDAELESIWELAKWPPTAANTQPLRVLFVRTDEGKEQLARHMSGNNADKVRSAPAVAVLALDTRFHEHIPTIFPMRPEMKDSLEGNTEGRNRMGSFSAALQAGYFILATRARGLAAGPMAGFDGDGIDAEFFPDGRFHTTLVVNIGHPGENPWFPRLPRLDHDDVISWA
jgi:3-hydroxypropanoate dehydrogenase